MLTTRPSHSVFQLVVLPYLANRSPSFPPRPTRLSTPSSTHVTLVAQLTTPTSPFSTSTSRSRLPASASTSTPAPDPWPATWQPPFRAESSQSRTREFLNLPLARGPPQAPIPKRQEGTSHEPNASTAVLPHERTAEMALKQIIESHTAAAAADLAHQTGTNAERTSPPKRPTRAQRKKAAIAAAAAAAAAATRQTRPDTTSPFPTAADTGTGGQYLPPMIHRLLSDRLHRLAVFHLLQTPEYATDQVLLTRAADVLDRQGAGKLARRLRRGWDGKANAHAQGRTTKGLMTSAASVLGTDVADPGSTPTPLRPRVWTDPEPRDRPRRPRDHWRHITTVSAAPNFDSFPTHQQALTNYHNAQLSNQFAQPNSASLSRSPEFKSVPTPNSGLRQLRMLLLRIDRLRHRGFEPDRVTANIVIRCWLRCGAGLAGGEENRFRIVRSRDGEVKLAWKKRSEVPFGTEELRSIFNVVKDLMRVPAAPGAPGALKLPGTSSSETTSTREVGFNDVDSAGDASADARLDYIRHIRPFARVMDRAFKRLGDHDGSKMVLKWLSEQRTALGQARKDDFRVGVDALTGVGRHRSDSGASGPSGAQSVLDAAGRVGTVGRGAEEHTVTGGEGR